MKRRPLAFFLLALLLLPAPGWAGLSSELTNRLEKAKYVYISSTRKDGTLGRPAEIWFLFHDGAVYVGTSPRSWRVRRIRAGRPAAKIWVGAPDGAPRFGSTMQDVADLPSFEARGEVVDEPETRKVLYETYAKKYPDGWKKHEENFRRGFEDGSRVMVKYVPK